MSAFSREDPRLHLDQYIVSSEGQTPTLQNLPPLLAPVLSHYIKRAMYLAALERSHLFCSCILDTYGYPYK